MAIGENFNNHTSFYYFATYLGQLADTRRVEEKIKSLTVKFQSSPDAKHIQYWLQFLSGEYVLSLKNEKISIGSQLIGRSASDFLRIDYTLVFKPCKQVMGRTPETISKLFENITLNATSLTIEDYSLSQIQNLLQQFSNCTNSVEKLNLLNIVWRTMRPIELRFFLQLLNGKLSVGCTNDILLNALASAYKVDSASVQALYRHNHSIVKTGLLAKNGNIDGSLKEDVVNSKIQTVLLYVQSESNGNLGKYSELTVGVRVDENENFGQDFIPIGKVTSGMAEHELIELKNRLSKLALEKFGSTHMLKPEIVIEVEYHQLVENKRTKAGYSIKSTRIVEFHWERTLQDVHSLSQVIDLHKNGR